MVETVCSVCGNKKSFENSNIGRTFKCPNCSNAVKIESVGSQLNEGTQVNLDSFTDEIRKAEAQKEAEKLAILEKQEKERILKEEENKQKTMIRLLIFFYPIGLYIM
jgi:DNA-directed RNA polymerase subunit RPC12/RpoP